MFPVAQHLMQYEEHFLVTGGAGFIGSHFLTHVVPKYPSFHFTCLDKLNYASNFSTRNIDELMRYPNFAFVQFDLAEDATEIYSILLRNHINNVVHFAAESCVDRSFTDPLAFVHNNIRSTQNLLELVRLLLQELPGLASRMRFVHISTDEVYGESESNGQIQIFNESSPLNPSNPYAASKASADLIIKSYHLSFQIPAVILRPNNVYGLNQFPEKLIPMTIQSLLSGEPITIHGTGLQTRSYIHVDDLVRGVELVWQTFKQQQMQLPANDTKIADFAFIGETFNIGSDDEIQNVTLVRKIVAICQRLKVILPGCPELHIMYIADRCYNDSRYKIDSSKLRKLRWCPVVEFESGLEALVKAMIIESD